MHKLYHTYPSIATGVSLNDIFGARISTTQITEGISAGMGIDLKSLLMGALGGKLAADNQPPVVIVPQVHSAVDAPVAENNETVTE